MAGLVDVAALVTGPTAVLQVAKLIAVLAKVEGLAGLGVMAALATPSTCVHLDAGVIGLGVVEGCVIGTDFVGHCKVDGGILEDDLRGKVVVGMGAGEGICTVMAMLLKLEELLSFICDVMGGMADAGIEGVELHNFHMECVIAF